MTLLSLIRDWLLERRIRLASANMSIALYSYGVRSFQFKNAAIAYDKLAIQRSPQQLDRMKGRGE